MNITKERRSVNGKQVSVAFVTFRWFDVIGVMKAHYRALKKKNWIEHPKRDLCYMVIAPNYRSH